MPISKCRICGNDFFREPLMRLENMPKAAQYLPDAGSLESDNGIELEAYQCSGCGLVQLNNDPVHYYKEVIRASAFSEEMKGFRIKQFDEFVQRFSLKGRKVVEIGCGRGEYLSLMQQAGAEVYGLEEGEESFTHCINRGLKVTRGFVQSTADRLSDAPFHAFYILSFLEHLPDPNATLRGIYNNLTDDAVGLVEVPNFDMILRNNLFSEFISDHLFYFTRETLSTLLRLNGFELIDCKEVWHDYIISALVKKGRPLDLSPFHEQRARLEKEINGYVGRFKYKHVAVWGAGHQALAVISLTRIAGKIKYVIDSAIFKQWRYTPGTHLEIVPPDALDFDPVDAVIVMAGSYSDEVGRIIQQRSASNVKVAILRESGLEEIA